VEYVRQYTGISLYNYAVSGAVCSNNITPRYFSAIDAPFPDIEQYELPAYIADSNYYYPNGTKFMNDPSNATVYAMWIGTNDLGFSAFIQDAQVNGTNINNYTDCVFDQLARVYDNGGRYFVLMNVAPLNLAPIYALPKDGGVGNNQYWNPKTGNYTEISYKMMEYVTLVNSIFEYRTPYAVEVTKRFPGASFAVYDVHGLVGRDLMVWKYLDKILTSASDDRHLQQPIRVPERDDTVERHRLRPPLQPDGRRLRDQPKPRQLLVVRRAAPERADRARYCEDILGRG